MTARTARSRRASATPGIYFSFNGGSSWTQPDLHGLERPRRHRQVPGPIGTLPNYFEAGLVSDGDPVIGLRAAARRNGGLQLVERLAALLREPDLELRHGAQGLRRSRASRRSPSRTPMTWRPRRPATTSAWSDPAIVTAQRQSSTTFSDKEAIWADNAASSPHFGNVYVCYTQFRASRHRPGADRGQPLDRRRRHLVAADDAELGVRQPEAAGPPGLRDPRPTATASSTRSGRTRHRSRRCSSWRARSTAAAPSGSREVIANVTDVGIFDGVRSISFDGIAGARTSSFPSLDIANGAPTGAGAPRHDGARLVGRHRRAQPRARAGPALRQRRPDLDRPRQQVEQSGDRPDFAFIGISPDGQTCTWSTTGSSTRSATTRPAPRRFWA